MIFGLGMEEVGGLECCLCTLGMHTIGVPPVHPECERVCSYTPPSHPTAFMYQVA